MSKVTQIPLFDGKRLQMNESIELTIQSLNAYGDKYEHWAIAWSGGKDSSTLLTLVIYLINSGKIKGPKSLTVYYADTRLELTPLSIAAIKIMDQLHELGYACDVVMAEMDKRFMVYMLGRGVPPPNNKTLRWCTGQIKIEPMKKALAKLYEQKGKVLMLTGVRQGESAIRDNRIVMSCSKDGAECGQGWYQESLPEAMCDTLAPILHWRVCHVWEWLRNWAPMEEFGDWDTKIIADAYGGDEAEEVNARTGCVGCPLAKKDTSLEAIIKIEKWKYLAPLLGLREVYEWLRLPQNRLRKNGETNNDGKLSSNPQRLGPIKLEIRIEALNKILEIQNNVNKVAIHTMRPPISIINDEEEKRIRELIANKTFPDRWDGTEIGGDVIIDKIYPDGTIMEDMFK